MEALENTHKIAQRCHVDIEFGVTKLPKFDVPSPYTSWEYLNKLCFEGLEERYPSVTKELKDRLNYELGVIKAMGYVDYFLIVWDFIHYARQNDIMVGPGRGSAAGSLVAYTLGITKLDPIRYNLLFERFLNPERVSMPDIDVDFCFEQAAGSHRLRSAQIRQRPGSADRDIWYNGGQRRDSGCGTCDGSALCAVRYDREAGAQ